MVTTTMRVPQHVVLVEDHPIFARALEAMLLDAFPGVSVHQCATLAEGGRVLGGLAKPALVLFDINLPDSAGSDGILRLRALSPASTFIILSAETNPLKIRRVQTNGAIGVIPKSIPAEDLPQTILGLLQLQKPDAPRSVATAGPAIFTSLAAPLRANRAERNERTYVEIRLPLVRVINCPLSTTVRAGG